MLYDFLVDHRDVILDLTRQKTADISEARPSSAVLERGLPIFYEHLIAALRDEGGSPHEAQPKADSLATSEHGKELSRLGYTVSQVVYGYGVICQAITEMAGTMDVGFGAREFSVLNLCLDKAIAEAVTEFEKAHDIQSGAEDIKRLGFLVHELRNALAGASLAYYLIKQRTVGTHGSRLGEVLERNLNRMRGLIDGALSEVRLNSEPLLDRQPLRIIDVAQEVEAAAALEGRSRGITLFVQVDPQLEVNADRQCLISAVANLVQNAMKFTKPGTAVSLRSREDEKSVMLDVEDCCGGLPEGHASELFKPFTQKGADRTGCGLGLAISRRAILSNDGDISIRNIPGKGCVFSISLPKMSGSMVPAPPRIRIRDRNRPAACLAGARYLLTREESVKTQVGLWIDHRKAVIVVVADKGEVTIQIKSNVEKQLRPYGGLRSKTQYGPQQSPSDDMRETVFMGHLGIYYDKVISCIRDAQAIHIFGPGEAKGELIKRLERNKLGGRIVGVATADKMTDRQIAAKVLQNFLVPTRKPRHKRRDSAGLSARAA